MQNNEELVRLCITLQYANCTTNPIFQLNTIIIIIAKNAKTQYVSNNTQLNSQGFTLNLNKEQFKYMSAFLICLNIFNI